MHILQLYRVGKGTLRISSNPSRYSGNNLCRLGREIDKSLCRDGTWLRERQLSRNFSCRSRYLLYVLRKKWRYLSAKRTTSPLKWRTYEHVTLGDGVCEPLFVPHDTHRVYTLAAGGRTVGGDTRIVSRTENHDVAINKSTFVPYLANSSRRNQVCQGSGKAERVGATSDKSGKQSLGLS